MSFKKSKSGLWLRDILVDQRGFMPGIMPFIGPQGAAIPLDMIVWLKTPIGGLNHDDNVTTWPDSSGNGNDFAGSGDNGGGNRPLYKTSTHTINGETTVYFDYYAGAAEAVQVTRTINTSGWTAATLYIVGELVADPPDNLRTGFTTMPVPVAADRTYFPFEVDSLIYDTTFTTVRKDAIDVTPSLADPYIAGWFSTANSWILRINGADEHNTGTNTFRGGNGVMEFGTSREGGGSRRGYNGTFAEIMLWDRILDAGEMAAVETYLSDKYAIAI